MNPTFTPPPAALIAHRSKMQVQPVFGIHRGALLGLFLAVGLPLGACDLALRAGADFECDDSQELLCGEANQACIDNTCVVLCDDDAGCQAHERCGPKKTCVALTMTLCGEEAPCGEGFYCAVDGTCARQYKLGDPCSAAVHNQCGSGFCVDGVCCASTCAGTCESCLAQDTGGEDGTCAPVPAGRDPKDECAGEAACSGESACAHLALGASCSMEAECVSGFCVDGVCCDRSCADPCHVCAATGACVRVEEGDDPRGECGNAACNGFGACHDRAVGSLCSKPHQCQSGFCVDGYCCSAACDDTCFACKGGLTGQSNGICAPVNDGLDDPDDGCADAAKCNGGGQCYRGRLGGTCQEDYQCLSGYCVDGFCCASACSGVCESCATNPGTCSAVLSGPDPGTCSASDLAAGCDTLPCTCDATSGCARAPGAVCGAGTDCASGVCAGGVCCEDACAGGCKSCNADHTGDSHGVCADVVDGLDPIGSCTGNAACNGAGVCYDSEKGDVCDKGYECVTGHCVEGLCCDAACADTCYACDGVGTASPPGTCDLVADGVRPAAECQGEAACNGAGACWAKGPGQDCGDDYECINGWCDNGLCARDVVALGGGGWHTCAVLDNGQLKCWGYNDYGQLGICVAQIRFGDEPGEIGAGLPVIKLGGKAKEVATEALHHSCAILYNDQVKCWGSNINGQLGLGDRLTRGFNSVEMGPNLPFVDLGTNRWALAIATGASHSCALLDGGAVKCWGRNNDGQLGVGSADLGGEPDQMGDNLLAVNFGADRSARAIAASRGRSCAILDNGQVRCWGHQTLGVGQNVPLGTGRSVKAMAVDNAHACAILDDDQVKCWGKNAFGQLGLGDSTDRMAPDQLGDNLPPVSLGSGRTARAITVGYNHSCVILDNNQVKCWGANQHGQLGLETSHAMFGDEQGEMGENLPTVALGTGRTAQAIYAGSIHSCVLLDNHQLKCWGTNSEGQLGLGDTHNRGDHNGEMGDNLPFVDL